MRKLPRKSARKIAITQFQASGKKRGSADSQVITARVNTHVSQVAQEFREEKRLSWGDLITDALVYYLNHQGVELEDPTIRVIAAK